MMSDWETAGPESGSGVDQRLFVSHFKRFLKLRHQLELRQGYTSVTALRVTVKMCRGKGNEKCVKESSEDSVSV